MMVHYGLNPADTPLTAMMSYLQRLPTVYEFLGKMEEVS